MPTSDRLTQTGPSAPDTAEGATVALVVCTHSEERRGLLTALIDSLASATRVPDEVIVVVDRNLPLLASLGEQAFPLPVRILASTGSGLSAARNTGWQATSSRFVAFTDDDAVASATWLEELLAAAGEHDADGVGGRIDARWERGEPAWYTPLLGWIVGCSYEGQPTTPTRVRNVIGCNMLFRRALLERLGGFDETLGRTAGGLAGCEETELCVRANRAGATILLIPNAAVAQVLPAGRGRFGYALRRSWDEGRSKRLLVQLHGRVLGTESRYARTLVGQAVSRVLTGILRRRAVEIERGLALLGVLLATGLGYAFQAVVRRGAAPVRSSGPDAEPEAA